MLLSCGTQEVCLFHSCLYLVEHLSWAIQQPPPLPIETWLFTQAVGQSKGTSWLFWSISFICIIGQYDNMYLRGISLINCPIMYGSVELMPSSQTPQPPRVVLESGSAKSNQITSTNTVSYKCFQPGFKTQQDSRRLVLCFQLQSHSKIIKYIVFRVVGQMTF